jgi:hypothetical protein
MRPFRPFQAHARAGPKNMVSAKSLRNPSIQLSRDMLSDLNFSGRRPKIFVFQGISCAAARFCLDRKLENRQSSFSRTPFWIMPISTLRSKGRRNTWVPVPAWPLGASRASSSRQV